MKLLALAVGSLLLGSRTMAGQTPAQTDTGMRLEISPFYGYLWGGTTSHLRDTSPLPTPDDRFAVGDHSTYGVRVGLRLAGHFEPEIEWSHTATKIENTGDARLGEVCSHGCLHLDYALGGVTYNIGGARGPIQPYASVSAGVLRLSPTLTIDSTAGVVRRESAVRFTGAVGAGVKVFFNPTLGVRVDARAYASRTEGLIIGGPICTTFPSSGSGGAVVPVTGDCGTRPWLYNGDLTGGVVLTF